MSTQVLPQRVEPVLHSHFDERHVSNDVHTVPHAPQFAAADDRSTSQPFDASSSQLPNPAEHVSTHDPLVQLAVPFVPVGQTLPQLPQLFASKFTLMQVPPQFFVGYSQEIPQTPSVHDSVVPHALPHIPQWLLLVFVSTHTPPQRVWPVGHGALHLPSLHTSLPLQALPQEPQLLALVCVSTHAPLHETLGDEH
jgi:hypothetical protein